MARGKEAQDEIALLEKVGWIRSGKTGSGHHKLIFPGTNGILIVSDTPSSRNFFNENRRRAAHVMGISRQELEERMGVRDSKSKRPKGRKRRRKDKQKAKTRMITDRPPAPPTKVEPEPEPEPEPVPTRAPGLPLAEARRIEVEALPEGHRECLHCGKVTDRPKFCSPKCSRDYWNERNAGKRPKRQLADAIECECCHVLFRPVGRGRPPKFCSDSCRARGPQPHPDANRAENLRQEAQRLRAIAARLEAEAREIRRNDD